MLTTSAPNGSGTMLKDAIVRARGTIVGIGILSAVLNVLLLGGSIYMMLVYDLVLPSRSVPTLLGLLAMVTLVYAFQTLFDITRARLLQGVSASVGTALGPRIHRIVLDLARTDPRADALRPVRDLDQIRGFLSGGGPTALIDLPWMVLFIAVLFLLHPLLGLVVLVGGAALVGLTLVAERLSAAPVRTMGNLASQRHLVAEGSRRHAEVISALGMEQPLGSAWRQVSHRHADAQARAAGVTGTLGSISKVARLLLQSLVLTVGAFLVMDGRASGGVIFASSILSSRALAPVELAIANWRGFVSARQSWARLGALLEAVPDDAARHALPAPAATLSVEKLVLAPAGSDRPTVREVSFQANAGEAIAILGPSGGGKSTLARGLVGTLPPISGDVRLDGAELRQWSRAALGRHIGYLPQNAELLAGTVAQNIARFDPAASADDVIAAATLAGCHDLVLHLPEGYETQVGPDGTACSAGQRQRIALARALYGDPFLIVLDEPNSNLDEAGEKALTAAVRAVCARGAIVAVVAHRASILDAVHKVLILRDGQVQAFGPKEAIVPDRRRRSPIPAPQGADQTAAA